MISYRSLKSCSWKTCLILLTLAWEWGCGTGGVAVSELVYTGFTLSEFRVSSIRWKFMVDWSLNSNGAKQNKYLLSN